MDENSIKKLTYISLLILTFFSGFILGQLLINKYNKYDVNNDGIVNSQDYVEIRKYIMSKEK